MTFFYRLHMKQLFALFSSILFCSSMFAQVNSGYYRVQNSDTNRYLYVYDNTGYAKVVDGKSLDLDIDAIYLRAGLDNAISDPGSIIYFENKGGNFNFYSQGTSSYSIIEHYLTITERNGIFALGAEESGIRVFMTDDMSGTSGYGSIFISKDGSKFWNVIPVSSNSENYFGASPSVKVGDKYYGSLYADFAVSPVSSSTKCYAVKEFSDCAVLLDEISGSVASQVPVIIEGASSSPSENKLDIVGSGSAPSNKLSGVFFNTNTRTGDLVTRRTHINQVSVNSSHRVIGVSASGELVFTKPNTSTLQANSAYLVVSSSAKDDLKVFFDKGEYDAYNANSLDKIGTSSAEIETFNLLGKKITNTGNLPAGIYIIGGKKTVIR